MYYFEYDKKNYLIKYKEEYKKKETLLCEIYVYNNKIIKFEEDRKFKNIIKYVEPIKILQRFEAGESWLNVHKKYCCNFSDNVCDNNDNIQRKYPNYYFYNKKNETNLTLNNKNDYPTIKQQFCLKNKEIYNLKFKIKECLIKNWVNLMAF